MNGHVCRESTDRIIVRRGWLNGDHNEIEGDLHWDRLRAGGDVSLKRTRNQYKLIGQG